MSVEEAAEAYGFTPRYIRTLLERRLLPCYKPSHRVLKVDPWDIERFLISRRRESSG